MKLVYLGLLCALTSSTLAFSATNKDEDNKSMAQEEVSANG